MCARAETADARRVGSSAFVAETRRWMHWIHGAATG